MLRLAGRQVEALRRGIADGRDGLITVILDDGQPVAELAQVISGESVDDGVSGRRVAYYRITDYLGPSRPIILVNRIRESTTTMAWILVHAGGTLCPPPLLELLRYIAGQEFTRPRFVIAVERLDLAFATPELAELIRLGHLIDLTAYRDTNYFREIVDPVDVDEQTLALLVHLFERLLTGPMPTLTTRSLSRTCSYSSRIGLRSAVKLVYVNRLPPGQQRDTVVDIIREVLGV